MKGVLNVCDKIYTIDEIKQIAAPIAARYGVERMYLFGSYARGDATAGSDMDFRIDKGKLRSMFKLAGMQMELEQCFSKQMDVLTTQMLSPQFLARIKPEEVLIYVQS